MTRHLVYPTPDELAVAAAEFLHATARNAVAERGTFSLALSGGGTPRAVFDAVVASGLFDRELVGSTHLYWGDERSVPNDHDQSNVRMARASLVDPLGFPLGNVHLVDGGAANLKAEAARYDDLLRRTLPTSPGAPPTFDLVLLGLGTDGHTASLFPGTAALDVADRLFVENEVPQLDTWRLTLTYPAINRSRQVLVLATGAAKAPVIDAIRKGDTGFPICGVRDGASEVLWMIDKAANGG